MNPSAGALLKVSTVACADLIILGELFLEI
jgi:hypothetical protein